MTTTGRGSGNQAAAVVGLSAAVTSITCSPPECQETNARFFVSVGLCAEKIEFGLGSEVVQKSSAFCSILYSAFTFGATSSVMSMNFAHPHGQPPESIARNDSP